MGQTALNGTNAALTIDMTFEMRAEGREGERCRNKIVLT